LSRRSPGDRPGTSFDNVMLTRIAVFSQELDAPFVNVLMTFSFVRWSRPFGSRAHLENG
jgi:hypothetical protein